jgi:hypothetical protein
MQPKVSIVKKKDVYCWKINTIFFYITLLISFYLVFQIFSLQSIQKELLFEKASIQYEKEYQIGYASVVVDKLKYMVLDEFELNQKMIVHSPYFQLEQFFNMYYPTMNIERVDELSEYLVNASMKYGIPPLLMASIIKRESNFNEKAIGSVLPSGARAKGLGQVLWQWHKEKVYDLGYDTIDALFLPEVNIDVATLAFKEFYDRNGGNVVRALTGYVGGNHPGYVNDVMNTYIKMNVHLYGLIQYEHIPFYRQNIILASN